MVGGAPRRGPSLIDDLTRMLNRRSLRLRAFLSALILLGIPATAALSWQQRVGYTMAIDLDAEHHSFTGRQRLVYVNNSPDTLVDVYYHLFYNAFRPGSMMDVRDRTTPEGGGIRLADLSPDQQGSVRVDTLTQEGTPLVWSVEETVLHARLARPLPPGDSTTFEMTWFTVIPRLTRRAGWMNREGVEFSMAQWYPKLAAYDETGWHADEYVLREFYGIYGTFDVAITLPAAYMVGGTGRVTNPEEVKCGYELGGIDTLLMTPTAGATGRKTWRFHAENVHDFAWVADREYVHRISRWRDITFHFLYKKGVIVNWQHAPGWTQALVAYYGRRFGDYSWPELTVAMAGDRGMEYPQLVMVTGYRDVVSLAGVLAHEIGHQWFYGMVGDNETQEAWLDEGFTQYLTDEARRDVFGFDRNPYRGLDSAIYPWVEAPERNVYDYLLLATYGYSEPLSTYHDWFRESVTAGLVYFKGEAVLHMLEGMLGRPLFDEAMRRYVEQRRYHISTARDFQRSVEQTTGLRLDWFFNEWIELNRTMDYAATDLSSERDGDAYRTTIHLERRLDAVMPLDVTLRYEDGTTAVATIPVETWAKPDVDFHLPRWRWVDAEYETTFATPKRVVEIEIDTAMLTVDLDRTNNVARAGFLSSILPPSHVAFYKRWDLSRPYDRYSIRLRPTLWYSQADAVQIGMVADGGYIFDRYQSRLGLYYNLRSKRIDYDLRYATQTDLIGRRGEVSAVASNADGVQIWSIGLSKLIRPDNFVSRVSQRVDLRAEREVLVGGNYPNGVAPWSGGGFNTITFGYGYKTGGGSLLRHAEARAELEESFASASDFTQLRLSATGNWNLLGIGLSTDLFAGGSLGAPPLQRMFNAAGATSRDMHDNVVQRLAMNANPGFMARNHLVLPTQGYLLSLAGAPEATRLTGNLINVRVRVPLPNPLVDARLRYSFPFLSRVMPGLYGAAGWLFPDGINWKGFSDASVEAGVYATLDPLEVLLPQVILDAMASPSPIRIGFYLPLVASSPLLEKGGVRYRWAFSVSM